MGEVQEFRKMRESAKVGEGEEFRTDQRGDLIYQRKQTKPLLKPVSEVRKQEF